ncbi:MAG: NTP transferase domain-containing protein [Spirulinaceae cyanobacterium SM2_1_0]|nr:NTP transferase domain-containing protein [Spirulinaceae cyanobacterium SM2_1_0]
MNHSPIPVILAGGKGERFWPLSRRQRPKQFLSLDGSGRSLLQATGDRLLPLAGDWQKMWVIASAALADGIRAQLPELPADNLLIEPEGRDTAAAVAWGSLAIAERYGEAAIAGFFPADHWIDNQDRFTQTLQAASTLAAQDRAIVTLGITPTYAATGYGYIEQGAAKGEFGGLPAFQVQRFTEKPDHKTAAEFIATQRFSWNSGMFVFQVSTMLAELQAYAPQILEPLAAQGVAAYSNLPKKSIDYAVMEQTQLACVLPVSFGWDDLGDWNALARLRQGEAKNLDLARHIDLDTQGAIIYASDDHEIVATLGLEDIVIVRDGKVTLVARKDRTQDIKKLLKQLQADPQYEEFL